MIKEQFGRQKTAFVSFGLCCLTWIACGQATFDPKCEEPQIGSRAKPTAITELSDGRVTVVNADHDERFCGGFLSVFSATGQELDPVLVQHDGVYEANFSSIATTKTHIWLAGRRLQTIVGINQTTLSIDFFIKGYRPERVFKIDDDLVAVWVLQPEPALLWINDAGQIVAQTPLESTTLASVTYDKQTQTVWLGYDGVSYAGRLLDNQFEQTPQKVYPLGLRPVYHFRGLLSVGDTILATDYAKGFLIVWDAQTAEPIAAEDLGLIPELIKLDQQNRLWLVDGVGAIYYHKTNSWQLFSDQFDRPSDLLVTAQTVWVTDFARNEIILLDAP